MNDHDDKLNNQLDPFVDEVNQLQERLSRIKLNGKLGNVHENLEHWRRESHRLIDEYIERKQQQLVESSGTKLQSLSQKINDIKTSISQLIQRQDATIEDLNKISSTMRSIRQGIFQLEHNYTDMTLNPLEIDQQLINIEDECAKHDFNLSTLMPPSHVMNRSPDSPKPLISNNRVLLMHYENQLCLLDHEFKTEKSIPWTNGWIWDMCWSSTLSQFFIITLYDIFMLDEKTMNLQRLALKDREPLCACTCSETSLYISTNAVNSMIYEFSLLRNLEVVNRWQPKDFCQRDEIIQDMVFNKGTIGFVIENQTSHTKRMELRLAETFELQWRIDFDLVDRLHNIYRLCSFNYNEWLVIDWKSAHIFYITNEGQMKSTCVYEPIPYRCCQFGPSLLAVSVKTGVNFHTL